MIAGVLAVIIKGTIDIGGFQTVLERSYNGGRIEAPRYDLKKINPIVSPSFLSQPNLIPCLLFILSFEMDFTDRHSFWSLSIGASVFMLQASILNQVMIQRFMALPTLSAANR